MLHTLGQGERSRGGRIPSERAGGAQTRAPPREQGVGPLLALLRSASLFILLIKPGPGENVLRPGWRGCQVGCAPPFPLLEPIQPLGLVSGTDD